jgi:2-methylcitrate dehydratase PrpD
MRNLTAEIAAFVAGNRYPAIPEAAIGAIKNALSDYAAVSVLGSNEETTRIVAGFEEVSDSGEARIFFSDRRTAARSAALINGTAAHAHDYDDVGIAFHPAHPSVAIAPAVLAQAEALGASGK